MLPDKSAIIDISSRITENNISVQGKDSFYRIDYYSEAFYDESEFKKFVKAVEKMVRKSDEYSRFIFDLKCNKGLDSCAILNNIKDGIEDSMADIEFHHYPFTLYDIVSVVTEKMLFCKEKVSTFTVAKRVIDLHLNHMVGVVPLCVTVHQLVHAGSIFINLNSVYGYYDKFIEEYKDQIISNGLMESYNKIVEMSKKNVSYSKDDILRYIPLKEKLKPLHEEDSEEE